MYRQAAHCSLSANVAMTPNRKTVSEHHLCANHKYHLTKSSQKSKEVQIPIFLKNIITYIYYKFVINICML